MIYGFPIRPVRIVTEMAVKELPEAGKGALLRKVPLWHLYFAVLSKPLIECHIYVLTNDRLAGFVFKTFISKLFDKPRGC